MLPGMELSGCQMAVPTEVMHHVVRVESSYNPYAIGVVGGRLVRQPKSLPEAVATARMLESRGYNFSLGLAQVNRHNLAKYGLDSYEKAFEVCPNLQAGARILAECYHRAGRDWGKSFSCYYSGNFVTGYRHGYVQKVLASMGAPREEPSPASAIEVVSEDLQPARNGAHEGLHDAVGVPKTVRRITEVPRFARFAVRNELLQQHPAAAVLQSPHVAAPLPSQVAGTENPTAAAGAQPPQQTEGVAVEQGAQGAARDTAFVF